MSYAARESGAASGAPVELYEFAWGTAAPQRYTSAPEDCTIGADTYAAATITRGKIEASVEQVRNNISIQTARDFPIADLFRVAPPSDVIAVTIKRVHRGDGEVAVIWQGRVINCEWARAQATLNCEPVSSSMRRTGLRRKYQRQCPHVLYGPACGVVRAAHSANTTVTAITGLDLSVAALVDRPWGGGFVEWTPPGGTVERRFIRDALGVVITLSQPFYGIAVGDAVTVSPGCAHTRVACGAYFENLANYGGFPFVPQKNPFDGNPVY